MDLTEYHEIITDVWHLLKWYTQNVQKHGKNDDFWKDLIRDVTAMTKRHDENRLAVALGLDVMTEVEAVWKEGQNEE